MTHVEPDPCPPQGILRPDEADDNDLLTVQALHDLLTKALAEGLSPDTAVVIGCPDHDWLQVRASQVGNPLVAEFDEYQDWLWLTLFTGAPADPRLTPAHETPVPEDDTWDPTTASFQPNRPCADHFVGTDTLRCDTCGWNAATGRYAE